MESNIKELCSSNDCKLKGFDCYVTTDSYYPPIYDKDGNNTNPDCNFNSTTVECLTCGKKFSASKLAHESEWKMSEQKPLDLTRECTLTGDR